MAAPRQLPLFEDQRPAGATTQFTGAGAPSTVRHHRLGDEVAFVVMARCTSVTFKLVEGSVVRQQVLQITDARVVDTDWAVAKLGDLAAAEEAEADRSARDRAEAQGITIIEPDEFGPDDPGAEEDE